MNRFLSWGFAIVSMTRGRLSNYLKFDGSQIVQDGEPLTHESDCGKI
jgi:hypothetical protein